MNSATSLCPTLRLGPRNTAVARASASRISPTPSAGYVYDPTRQTPGSDAWGHLPRPGTAEVMQYPDCKDGRVVADVIRAGKGHTEGLEPKITEGLVQLMVSAKGGKIQQVQ